MPMGSLFFIFLKISMDARTNRYKPTNTIIVSMGSIFLAKVISIFPPRVMLKIMILKETKKVTRYTNGIEPKDFFSLRYLTIFIADHKNKIDIKKTITGLLKIYIIII
jgi:hypothetical protein